MTIIAILKITFLIILHRGASQCTLRAHYAHYAHFSKLAKTPEKKTLEFRSRKGGDGIRPFKLRVIQRESVKLGRKGDVFNI
jgi:hypothetical protein